MAKLRITQIKSVSGYDRSQKMTMYTLGLKRINQSVVRDDSLSLRGQIIKVKHLVMVEEEDNEAK